MTKSLITRFALLIFALMPVFELNEYVFYFNAALFIILVLYRLYLFANDCKKYGKEIFDITRRNSPETVCDLFITVMALSVCYSVNAGGITYLWWVMLGLSTIEVVRAKFRNNK